MPYKNFLSLLPEHAQPVHFEMKKGELRFFHHRGCYTVAEALLPVVIAIMDNFCYECQDWENYMH